MDNSGSEDSGDETDNANNNSSASVDTMTNTCIAYSTIPGFVSKRSKDNGSLFIQAICSIWRANPRLPSTAVFTEAMREVSKTSSMVKTSPVHKKRTKQIPIFTSMLTQHYRLNGDLVKFSTLRSSLTGWIIFILFDRQTCSQEGILDQFTVAVENMAGAEDYP